MTTNSGAELTLFDTLSRLTFSQAARLLGHGGGQLITAGGKYDIDIVTQVELKEDEFRLTIDTATVTLTLNPGARNRLQWRCSSCDVPCDHAGAAFSLVLEEQLALRLAAAPPEAPIESLTEEALIAQALAERMERARTEKMRLTSSNPQEIWTDYTLTNAASGKSYRVALRGWQAGDSPMACVPAPTASARFACISLTARAWSCACSCRRGSATKRARSCGRFVTDLSPTSRTCSNAYGGSKRSACLSRCIRTPRS